MPKIEIYRSAFYQLLGTKIEGDALEELFQAAKAEVDEVDVEQDLLKVELNDTNRPDLWSTAGLARALRLHRGETAPIYDFVSSSEVTREAGEYVVKVDKGLANIRPFIAAFVATGPDLTEPQLKDVIQTQEKLCWNYGQKRKSIAMGYYRSDLVSYPVTYRAADPVKTRFVPLGEEKEMNLKEILQEHPKGLDFALILKDFHRYPYLEDSEGQCLSFPPIINSASLGAVEVGDNSLFVELTGIDMESLLVATSIAACDMADMGFTIRPVRIEYPYDTPFGRTLVTPYYFQNAQVLDAQFASRLLGETITAEALAALLQSKGHDLEVTKGGVVVQPPVYRNDYLHPVDLVEEVMVAREMTSFEPVMPEEYTIGRLSDAEMIARRVRDIMIGLGYQEMIYNYLGSHRDIVERMNISEEGVIGIDNPMTENYAVLRNSILPNLLQSEAVSANAVYPHRIFEVGKVAFPEASDNQGTVTRNNLGFLLADRNAGFNELTPAVASLFYYLVRDYELQEVVDPRFIQGRTARIFSGNRTVGILGEIAPRVLTGWGITMPCACVELDVDFLTS